MTKKTKKNKRKTTIEAKHTRTLANETKEYQFGTWTISSWSVAKCGCEIENLNSNPKELRRKKRKRESIPVPAIFKTKRHLKYFKRSKNKHGTGRQNYQQK